MSARSRVATVDALIEEALAIEVPAADFEPGVARLETLLRALVEVQAATVEALVEANEHRQLAYRIEHPGVEYVPTDRVSSTRPYTGA